MFARGQSNLRDLWTVNLSDPDSARAEVYLSSEANLPFMLVSPDGTLAAYMSNESGVYETYIRSFPEPGERTIASQGEGGFPSFSWSPDGNTLYYGRSSGDGATIIAARIERNPVPVVISTDSLFTTPALLPYQGAGLHPDGDRFVFAQNVGAVAAEGGASVPDRLILVQNFFEELKARVPN